MLPIDERAPSEFQSATLGLGCFWGPDARFGVLDGVIRTRVGYGGGSKPDPTYQALGDHTEVLQVDFDPSIISYDELLGVFWMSHNPTRAAYKRQYRSVILAADDEQREAAEQSRMRRAEELGTSIETDVEPLDVFYRAEDYHQKYRLRHENAFMETYRQHFGDAQAFTDSTATARVNGYVAGHGNSEQLEREIDLLGLDSAQQNLLRQRIQQS